MIMKKLLTLLLSVSSTIIIAQTTTKTTAASSNTSSDPKSTTQTSTTANPAATVPVVQEPVVNPRSAATSTQSVTYPSAKLPYDVDDIYMGRKQEFLNKMIVSELPADFPVYEKQYNWGVKEYNAVVNAYFINHPELLKKEVKEKLFKTK